jgi:alpha-N-arabinofuranosidase
MFAEYLGTEVPKSSASEESPRFFYSVTRDPSKGKVYLKLVNAYSVDQPVELSLSGVNIQPKAALISLSGMNPAETNTIKSPTRIEPVKSTVTNAGAQFSHAVPAYSIQVMVMDYR